MKGSYRSYITVKCFPVFCILSESLRFYAEMPSANGELLPAGDQEEECEDDQEGEASHGCCDDDQHLPLVGGHVWRWG